MVNAPRILALGGLDPTGGAGLTAYARMAQARGGLALPIPTCLTIQNRHGLHAIHPVSSEVAAASIQAALEDGPVDAVVVGLLGTPSTAREAARLIRPLAARRTPVVVDPVLSATAGGWAGDHDLVAAYRSDWLPLATVVTPNLDELHRLAGSQDPSALLALGAMAVLVTGGDGVGDSVEDRLHTADEDVVFAHSRRELGPVHGTGCALATALACELGAGRSLEAGAKNAIAVVGKCLDATTPARDGLPVPLRVV